MTEVREPWDLDLPGGVRARIGLEGAATGGAFTLVADEAPPGWRTPPHRHERESETIHVVEGWLWLQIDGHRSELGPGATAHVPRDVVHSGGTLGAAPVRRVLVFAPAGPERLFVALQGVTDPSAQAALFAQHGWRSA